MITKNSQSDSDISTNSSWTIIDDTPGSNSSNLDENLTPENEIDIEVIKTTEVLTISNAQDSEGDAFVKVTLSESSLKTQSTDDEDSQISNNETKENGFLTFDEYLRERMLEHDYEYPSKSIFKSKLNKSQKFKKGRKKCKAETVGVLSLCASLLTVTGVTLLCLVFPENIETKSFDSIKSNYQAIIKNDSIDYKNIVSSFNKTMEILNTVNNSNMFEKCANSLMTASEFNPQPYNRPESESKTNRHFNRKTRTDLSGTNIFKNDMCFPHEKSQKTDVCYINEKPQFTASEFIRQKKNKSDKLVKYPKNLSPTSIPKLISTKDRENTSVSTIQFVLRSTNLRRIIQAIIHDICILKLMTYFNNSRNSSENKRKSTKEGKKASKRKLLEAIADGIAKINIEEVKTKKVKTIKKKRKSKRQIAPTESAKQPLCITSNLKNQVSKNALLAPTNVDTKLIVSHIKTKFVNGKNECERKFQELDCHKKKSTQICLKHKTYIQQIKEKYLNEIDTIKDSNIEPILRIQKIRTLKENYRIQLKKNRDIYLKEMCKIKRNRTKMLKELCAQKRNELELRDASVGNYVVPIAEDFYTNLQKLKKNEIPSLKYTESNKKEQEKHVFQFKISKELQDKTNPLASQLDTSLDHSTKKDLMVLPQSTKRVKKCKETFSSDIPAVFGLSLNFDFKKSDQVYDIKNEQDTCNAKRVKTESQPKESSGESEKMEVPVPWLGIKKHTQNNLYQVAFEKKGEMIKKSDISKWKQQRIEQWEKYRKELSKQNPQKSFRPNIFLYKY